MEKSRIISARLEDAKQRHVEEFHFALNATTLKPNIFISRTLVVLKLEMVHIARNTSCVHLPSLKTLLLCFVYFENQNNYINYLSACPNLEDLHAYNVYYYEKKCTRKEMHFFSPQIMYYLKL
jgi:hypothetical protein